MVLLNSENIKLGSFAPDFNLKGIDGKNYLLENFSGSKVLVVMFICVHCPYVKAVEDRILALSREYKHKSVQFVGICSNDPTDYPEDRFENIKKHAWEKGYNFPYLHDETQCVARNYGAVCTPDIFVYDSERKLAYHGRIDDNWKEPSKVTRHDLKEAIDALLAGKKSSEDQFPSMGCSIKWREE